VEVSAQLRLGGFSGSTRALEASTVANGVHAPGIPAASFNWNTKMALARILCRVAHFGMAATLLVGCSGPALLDDNLTAGGAPATEFSIDDQSVTLSARFDSALAPDAPLMVEWLFPDGKVYLRKPVRRSHESPDLIETMIPVRDKAPARHPGVWHVRLWRGGDTLVDRSFELRKPAETAASAGARFAGIAYCGPSRWNDPVISGRRSASKASVAGAWVGGDLLSVAGATYSSAVLLTGCAPG
jgi:hypothetical protein